MGAVLLLQLVAMATPGPAGAQQCPEATPTYTSACGPTFVLAPWGDAGGWTDPSKYSTIQLADFNGDGKDELAARNDQGLEIWTFDTSLGQWRPQVDADGVPQALTDFRSPRLGEALATNWTQAQYYSTIQAADVDGQPGEEILARFADGMRVYKYSPPAGARSIDGGGWQAIASGGPFTDAGGYAGAALYSTIHVGRLTDGGPAMLYARRPSTTFGQTALQFFAWSGSGWTERVFPSRDYFFDFIDQNCSQPSCYLTLRTADLAPGARNASDDSAEVIGRTSLGVGLWDVGAQGQWELLNEDYDFTVGGLPPFADAGTTGYPDCPFSAGGATGPGSGDCVGSSPSYYETLQPADVDGLPGDELIARASDGLRVRKWEPGSSGGAWDVLPTLTALSGAPAAIQPGEWGSIRAGDLDDDGKQEVLALDGTALQAWTYDRTAKAWSRLQPSVAPKLTGAWMTRPEYYATIRLGDVDGDGRDDVVARGPFGIRTWFYDRRKTGGWERYLPEGYQPFLTDTGQPDTGKQNAFDALNALALQKGAITAGKLRDVWTGATPPDRTTLSDLRDDLLKENVGNCPAGNQTTDAPPVYSACLPPSGSTGYDAEDWTAAVNEVLKEIYFAGQVLGHFGDVDTIRRGVFESETGALPAIGSDLQLAGAAGTSTTFDLQNFFAGTTGIAASLAGLVTVGGPEVSAALWVASEIVSMLPSASPTATSTFQATYGDLLTKLGTAQDEMATAQVAQSQQVRADQSLLELVGQLRSRGTWKPDVQGIQSASRQAFAQETYRVLMPTVFDRFVVSNCANYKFRYCSGPSPGPGVIGNSQSFTTVGLPPTTSLGLPSTPCIYHANTGTYYCRYAANAPPAALMKRIWGPVSAVCDYQPPNLNTLWTYGCSLGVPAAASVRANAPGWTFTTHAGTPVTTSSAVGAVSATASMVRARAAGAGSDARAAQLRATGNPRAARELLGPVRSTGRVALARGLRLRRARVVVERTLFEHGRREELARSRSGRRLRPFTLNHLRGGLFASERRGGPRVRLGLRRLAGGASAELDLRLTGVRTRDIRELCTILPAGVSRAGRPLELETRLRLRDRGITERITTRQAWRCVRDGRHEFTAIRPVKPKPASARPGLAVRLQSPRALASGRHATVRVTLANQRRARPGRVVSSLWHVRLTASAGGPPRVIGFKELRAGRSRTVRVTVRMPRGARRRACVRVAATAHSARPALARRCVGIARLRSTG